MERNPAGSYGALFVVAKGLSSKIEWKEEEKNKHSYEVLGGTHLSLATKRLHEKYPENPHFAGRMCRIYVGLSDEQAVYLGGMHQHSSMFQHEVTYREEVERCRMQLFGDRDITGEPPEPRPSWRDDCSLILGKEKKSLSEIFAMAKVSKAVWKEFQEVNSLFEMGRLKEQKVSSGEIVRGAVSLKQWHMKPLCSLTDEQRLPLLLKLLKEKKISLKEVKEEAYKLKALSQVREAIVKFFKLNSWQEAETKFGASVHPERLLRFKGDFEKLHEFKMFLKHLKQKIEWADTDYANTDNCIVGPDGVTKGRVVFIKQHEDVDQNSAFLESGAFLSIAHVGYTDQDVVSEIKDVVELVVRINFKRLMTIFNIVFICSVGIYREVQEAVSLQGAAKTQFGFIVNKIPPLAREDLLMTEVVECFVVCHWAVSYNKLTERHVSRAATNVIEVIRDGSCQPRELYESLIETFSKEGDLVLDIGSANGNGMLAAVRLKRPSVSINKHTTEDMRWHLLENIREKNHFPLE